MSKENAKIFYQKFLTDPELQEKVMQKGEKNQKEQFIEVAKAEGFDFTAKDFEDLMSVMTVAEANQMMESDFVTKGESCFCFAGGGGNSGQGGRTCGCVGGGAGLNDSGQNRCLCIAVGSGS